MTPPGVRPRQSLLWRLFKWLTVLTLATCGCCGGMVTMCTASLGTGGGGDVSPLGPIILDNSGWTSPGASDVDLGTAAYPAGTVSPIREYAWKPEPAASTHRFGYLLASGEARALQRRYRTFANSPASPCADLECAYEFIYRTNEAALSPVVDRFIERVRAAGLKADDAAALVLTFVQEIRYEIPKDQPFEVLPAALVLSEGRGDCDSKAVLAVMLLRRLGVPALVLVSVPLAHAGVGVALPGGGLSFLYRGRSYRYVEITAPGWPIGEIAPKMNKPRLWSPVWIGPSEKKRAR